MREWDVRERVAAIAEMVDIQGLLGTLASRAFQSLPERTKYMDTAAIAQAPAALDNHNAVQDALIQEINATWLLPRSPHETLQHAQQQVERVLERTQR